LSRGGIQKNLCRKGKTMPDFFAFLMLSAPFAAHMGPVTMLPGWIEWVLIVAVWGLVLLTYAHDWVGQASKARLVLSGLVSRRIACPERGRRARIEVLYTEPEWGTLKVADIVRCSVFGSAPVSCAKKCLGLL
jgi:hypothetical protein